MPGMQFPYPRKDSDGPEFYPSKRAAAYSSPRRRNPRQLAFYALITVLTIWVLLYILRRSPSSPDFVKRPPAGTPEVVIVTTLNPDMSERWKANIVENRRDYAARHGYATFFPNSTDYDLMPDVPHTWSTIPACRHAMALHPSMPWIWYLTSTALIMNPQEDLWDKLLAPAKLESLMIVDRPVVPPDSVIRTFGHLKGDRVDLVLSQDREGLAGGSMLIRNGEWGKYFLDVWFTPLYRSYNFQKAEGHALEHMVQWHGTILAKLALVPQRVLNSYTRQVGGKEEGHDGE